MATSTSAKVGRGLAKFLRIKPHANRPKDDDLTRGESAYSVSTADTYVEHAPTAAEWVQHVAPTGPGVRKWLFSLFPFAHWITRYNVQWLYGDLVAGESFGGRAASRRSVPRLTRRNIGITVGCVVVPQSMAYAELANLPHEFGLYSSFMGVLIYWFFATSKDITIGVSIAFPPLGR